MEGDGGEGVGAALCGSVAGGGRKRVGFLCEGLVDEAAVVAGQLAPQPPRRLIQGGLHDQMPVLQHRRLVSGCDPLLGGDTAAETGDVMGPAHLDGVLDAGGGQASQLDGAGEPDLAGLERGGDRDGVAAGCRHELAGGFG